MCPPFLRCLSKSNSRVLMTRRECRRVWYFIVSLGNKHLNQLKQSESQLHPFWRDCLLSWCGQLLTCLDILVPFEYVLFSASFPFFFFLIKNKFFSYAMHPNHSFTPSTPPCSFYLSSPQDPPTFFRKQQAYKR